MAEHSSSEDEHYLLLKRLSHYLSQSTFEKEPRKFMPEGVLDGLINRRSILDSMAIKDPNSDDDDLVDFILKKAKKVFATSVSIGLGHGELHRAMLEFMACDFDDHKLPIEDTEDDSESILASLETGIKYGSKIWSPFRIHAFCDCQWRFLVPVFSTAAKTDIHKYNLPVLAIIPFVKKHSDFYEDSLGKVYKYEIHPNHIKDPLRPGLPCPKVVAVKEIRLDNNETRQQVTAHWEAEIKALERMTELNQDHMVRFITAFCLCTKEHEDHYLMFEGADGGNLKTLWEATPLPHLSASLVKAAIWQLFGLADALSIAHYPPDKASYRHGNLNPANILRFDDGSLIGTLKISDWGEAKAHNNITELRFSKTTAAYDSPRYQAPEVETGVNPKYLGLSRQHRSRLSDIWAMGCITLEFMIWLLYGLDELKRFNRSVKGQFFDNSPFYQVHEEGEAMVHSAVVQRMDRMAQDPACRVGTTALGDLLELVRSGLLVVRLPRRVGSNLANMGFEQSYVTHASALPPPEPALPARLLATDFRRRVECILAEEDESYWFTDA